MGRTRGRLVAAPVIAILAAGCAAGSGTDEPPATPAQAQAGGTLGGDAVERQSGGSLVAALRLDSGPLDPTFTDTVSGKTVFANMCEKLYDVDEQLEIVPQLAAELPEVSEDGKRVTIRVREGVRFNDGTPLDAEAVKTSLDRMRGHERSVWASDLAAVESVGVVDPMTVELRLKQPHAPLTSTLADRAGIVMSPTQLHRLGDDFADDPVCVGPFSFVEYRPADRVILERAEEYYDADEVVLDQLVFRIITEPSVRAANLRSGDVDVANLTNSGPAVLDSVESDPGLQTLGATSLGWSGAVVNIDNKNGLGEPPADTGRPLADPRLREAFDLSIDSEALARVVFKDTGLPACGPISPASPWYQSSLDCRPRDLERARKLVEESGAPTPVPIEMVLVSNSTVTRLGEVIQAMAKEAGFAVTLQPMEGNSALDRYAAGDFDLGLLDWSGRVDPHGNIAAFVSSEGSVNFGGYSDATMDDRLQEAAATNDRAERARIYGEIYEMLRRERPYLYLYRRTNLLAAGSDVVGVSLYGDGVLRFKHAGLAVQ